jgi:hypothetical protein
MFSCILVLVGSNFQSLSVKEMLVTQLLAPAELGGFPVALIVVPQVLGFVIGLVGARVKNKTIFIVGLVITTISYV